MRHLITGGAGFLGSHLCHRLIAAGQEVIAFDNFFTGHRRNVEALIPSHNFELVRGDVCDPFHFEVDRIWSLACPASPVHYQHNAARTLETAILGTFNSIKLSHRLGARLFLASTSEVYGDPEVHPQPESYRGSVNHVGPRACYDSAKCAAEAIVSSWERQYDVQVRIGRFFNTYGPRMQENDGRVVSTFICQALRGKPLTIFGDGSQTRSFCYVDDLIDGMLALMESGTSRPVNLGNPGEFTMLELAELVLEMTAPYRASIGTTIRHEPLPADDPARRRPDISRAIAALGWYPKVQLREGLQRTIDYFAATIRHA